MAESFNIAVAGGHHLPATMSIGRCENGSWVGACRVQAGAKTIRIRATVSEQEIKRKVLPLLTQMFKAWQARSGGQAHVGLFGFIKKAWKKVRRVVRKIAKAKILRRIGSTLRRVIKNPIIAKLAGFAKYIPVYGTAIHAGYKTLRKAMSIAEGIAKRVPRSLRAVSKLKRLLRSPRANAHQRMRAAQALRAIRITYTKRFGYGRRGRRGRVQYRRPARGRRYRGYVRGNVSHVGAMEGAKWLWDELKPHRGVKDVPSIARSMYVDGLRAMG